ncbi:gelatinase b [Fusarium albosuccineum]|uniref:Gelatinase b n=1 Tax=Fusarium albosuccineum TaxID=1237068 RepID=A0A8H4L282_9HYPO|nr:gelatinase b [Fusarium albosuccineum]
MWSLPLFAALLALTPLSLAKKPTPCPTVTSTATVCSTCIVKECLAISTISNPRSCPPKVSTTTTSYPCKDKKCPAGCASTSYVYATTYGQPTITKKPCPTVTSVQGRCSTCMVPMCMAISTISSQCGCPKKPATVTTSYACNGKCPGGCAGTELEYLTTFVNNEIDLELLTIGSSAYSPATTNTYLPFE